MCLFWSIIRIENVVRFLDCSLSGTVDPVLSGFFYTSRIERMTRSHIILWFVLLPGCMSLPITDGMHSVLPPKHAKVVVWGNDTRTSDSAMTWLKKRKLVVIERGALKLSMDEKSLDFSHTLEDEAIILRVSRELGIKMVVFVDRVGDLRAPMVAIRGVDVDNHQILWSGSARYPNYSNKTPSDLLVNLTCQALATAWGYQTPGTQFSALYKNSCESSSQPLS